MTYQSYLSASSGEEQITIEAQEGQVQIGSFCDPEDNYRWHYYVNIGQPHNCASAAISSEEFGKLTSWLRQNAQEIDLDLSR